VKLIVDDHGPRTAVPPEGIELGSVLGILRII
jgi:hypothetical protein